MYVCFYSRHTQDEMKGDQRDGNIGIWWTNHYTKVIEYIDRKMAIILNQQLSTNLKWISR